jgi:hypothetical protein
VRHSTDPAFQNILRNIRLKTVSFQDYDLLRKRLISNLPLSETEKFKDSICILATIREVDQYNHIKLASLQKPIVRLNICSVDKDSNHHYLSLLTRVKLF